MPLYQMPLSKLPNCQSSQVQEAKYIIKRFFIIPKPLILEHRVLCVCACDREWIHCHCQLLMRTDMITLHTVRHVMQFTMPETKQRWL